MVKQYLLIILVVISTLGCKDQPDALEYNQKLSIQNNRVADAVNTFYFHLQNDDLENADTARKYIVTVCDSVVFELKAINAFEGDSALCNALINYVQMQKNHALNEYLQLMEANKIIEQLNNPNQTPNIDAIAKAYLTADSIDNVITLNDSLHYTKASALQRKFALKHGFEIDENEAAQQDDTETLP
jgi:hypothetical protein